jgi:putative chitinase
MSGWERAMATGYITGTGVNLRRSAGGSAFDTVNKGLGVERLETSGSWTHVEFEREGHIVTGWVSSQFVSPAAPVADAEVHGLSNPGAFFNSLTAIGPMAGGVNQAQKAGCEAILAACTGLPLSWTAYVLATACLETGRTFKPDKKEGLDYSVEALIKLYSPGRISVANCRAVGRNPPQKANQDAIANFIYGGEWGRANLGNQQSGDGFLYRGRGWVQMTGRRNYARADNALKLGGALVANPDLLGDRPEICALSAIQGMQQGWFTTRKFSDYLPDHGPATVNQYTLARKIINGQDKAPEIAAFAMDFQSALMAGGWR